MKLRSYLFSYAIWTVLLASLSFTAGSQSRALDIQALDLEPHSYYSYSSALVEDEIDILVERNQEWTLDAVRSADALWKANTPNIEPERKKVYWTRLELHSDRADTILLEFGLERHYSWRDISYFVVHQDSIIAQGQSGNKFTPRDKPIRSAVNLAQFPIAAGVNYLYCRLDGFEVISDDPLWFNRFNALPKKTAFYIHDRSTYKIIDAFIFPGGYTKSKRGHFFGTNYFKQGIEVMVDESKKMTVDAVASEWDQNAGFYYDTHPDRDSVYWMRFKIIGTEAGPGNYLFGPSTGSHWNFDSIEVFTRANNEKWTYQLTGNAVAKATKSISTDWNLFRVKVPPRDTQEVYLKLTGAGKRFVPMFAMTQFEEDSFWPNLFTVQWIYGGFFSILITTSIYFFILGYTERRNVQFWFVGLIFGFGILLAFMGADVNYFLFPKYEEWHPWLAATGGFFIIAGLYQYIKDYLSLNRVFGIQVNRVFNPLILIHFLICLYFGYSLYSIGGNVAIFELYFQLFIGSIVLNFLLALVIGVVMMCRGNLYARFFVIAFGALLVLLLIRLAFAFGSFNSNVGFNQETISTGIYIHYLLFLGVTLMIILLAFGNGYRINQLKKSAIDAALKSQEKEMANNFLRENNQAIKLKSEENEMLVKEIHHRVRNNLQVLASLLNLQSNYISDAAAYNAIVDSKTRVEAMGMIHQLLYLGDSGRSSIDMARYLDELCSYYQNSFISDNQAIKITHDISVDHLDIDTAIPIGLTITELVTNSKKHAFGNNQSGAIKIKLWINEGKQLCLEVSDDGVGLDQSLMDSELGNFGTELIRILSKKLRGVINVNSEMGYTTRIVYDRYAHYPNPI